MKDQNVEAVSYLVYESTEFRSERIITRLVVALVIVLILLFGSNLFWIWAVSSNTVENENGTSNYIGEDGEIRNHGD